MRRREHPDKTFYRGNVELSELADSMNTVYRTVEENGLREGIPEKLEREIKVISEIFGISKNAAILLPCIVERSLGNGSCNQQGNLGGAEDSIGPPDSDVQSLERYKDHDRD